MKDAACKGHPNPDIFHPERETPKDEMTAKLVCMTCEVRSECENYRQKIDSRFGIWGGVSQKRGK